ncbi:VOC family protein [Pseudooctadecabacter sp.]|uniref:VOC family protein n=1 Tax=Pseudooctadecabacter sp. TaxID=1966338 RepID=UPI0025F4D65E|nr:VOC family protein [Pseudooctadecabacter sp.]
MQLGAFSISLSVKDLAASIAFYTDLGFERFGGHDEHGYAIMKNGDTLVGLFQGMFEGNMLTFNPGWDQSAGEVTPFDDVRAIKDKVTAAGHEVIQEQGGETGPASFVVIDPDGNPILFDQHR